MHTADVPAAKAMTARMEEKAGRQSSDLNKLQFFRDDSPSLRELGTDHLFQVLRTALVVYWYSFNNCRIREIVRSSSLCFSTESNLQRCSTMASSFSFFSTLTLEEKDLFDTS